MNVDIFLHRRLVGNGNVFSLRTDIAKKSKINQDNVSINVNFTTWKLMGRYHCLPNHLTTGWFTYNLETELSYKSTYKWLLHANKILAKIFKYLKICSQLWKCSWIGKCSWVWRKFMNLKIYSRIWKLFINLKKWIQTQKMSVHILYFHDIETS